MTLKELKNHFNTFLDSIYPIEEIGSFYHLLLESQMNLKRIDIALEPNKEIPPLDVAFFNKALQKLKQEIPIQYILEETEFYGLPFKVNSDTLIPRPETEELVDWIISTTLNNRTPTSTNNALTILDIGTGSGCIAISIAKNLPNAKIYALDISEKALIIAKQNAKLNKVAIEFIEGDILTSPLSSSEPITHKKRGLLSGSERNRNKIKFDIIVSNPPYVRELEKEEIKNNVLKNEPHLALFVKDSNPLLFYDKIADFALKYLKPNGQLFFEINQYLGEETAELLEQKGFFNIELRKDIFDNYRMIRSDKNT
ncbi:MAG: peptide chain release factor N(5)-glutamine methyltransferase [Flavobacteriaceae bacterium]|nr:peptide chain release factor N(5)-glutamine methyltransferase [Flavobacteriaceae bacterium]